MSPICSSRSILITLSQIILLQCCVNAQTCYYPNGDVAKDSKPCSSGVMCCPDTWDCLSNGLCQLRNAGYFGRYSCTDKSWSQDSGCPQFCTNSALCVFLLTEWYLTEVCNRFHDWRRSRTRMQPGVLLL